MVETDELTIEIVATKILDEAPMAERSTLLAKAWCAEAARAIDHLDALERAGNTGKEHDKARSAVRKAVLVVQKFASSDEERELCFQFLKDLRSYRPRSSALRIALVPMSERKRSA